MIVRKCDICKKDIGVWYAIDIRVDAANSFTNVAPYLKHQGQKEICTECFAQIKDLISQKMQTL